MSEESTSDVMAADAVKVRKPKGSPNLWPFQQLPRRKRAEFLRKLATLQETQKGLSLSEDGNVEPDISDAAGVFDLLADLEDTLRIVAEDADAFDAWVAKCSDTQLQQLSTWYMDRFQVGEAQASST